MENEYEKKQPAPQRPKGEPRIQTEGMSTVKKVKMAVGAVLAILLLLLIFFNRHSIQVSLIFTEVRTPLFLLVPLVFLVGVVVGYILRKK